GIMRNGLIMRNPSHWHVRDIRNHKISSNYLCLSLNHSFLLAKSSVLSVLAHNTPESVAKDSLDCRRYPGKAPTCALSHFRMFLSAPSTKLHGSRRRVVRSA